MSGLVTATGLVTLAEAMPYLSWWKAILFVLPFLPWAWVISKVYDKDTARWYFKRELWNVGHVVVGAVAVAAFVVLPLEIFATLPIVCVLLIGDLLFYAVMRNKHENVPEEATWTPATVMKALTSPKAKGGAGAKKEKGRKVKGITLTVRGKDGVLAPPEDPESPEFVIRVAAEDLYQQMAEARGYELELAPVGGKKDTYTAVIAVDGIRRPIAQIAADQAAGIIDFFKLAAGLDLNDRRRRLKGLFEIGASPTSTMEVGITTAGTSAGPRMQLVVEPTKRVTFSVDGLGFQPRQLEDIRELTKSRGGVVLVATPQRGGRTSLFYAVVKAHDAYTSNVQTIETDPQRLLEGVTTSVFDPQEPDAEYSTLVRSILRRDPDVVGIADLPDQHTAREIAQADLERTRVYVCFNAENGFEAIKKYVAAVGDAKLAAKGLRGVVAGRLVRRLCENCKVPYKPTPDLLKKLGLPVDTQQLYKKGGTVIVKEKEQECPQCSGDGYFGQVGAMAVYQFDTEARRFIASGDEAGLRGVLRQNKQTSIQTAALSHIARGVSSIEEVQRALTPQAKPKRGGGADDTKKVKKSEPQTA